MTNQPHNTPLNVDNGLPDELDIFIATHTSVSGDTDEGVYREAEYYALKNALGSLVKKQVEALLDRLESQTTIFKIQTYNQRGVKHTATAGSGVPVTAIQAERKKLEHQNDKPTTQ